MMQICRSMLGSAPADLPATQPHDNDRDNEQIEAS